MADHPLAGRHVLVVEDEFFVAKDLKQALARAGARVLGPAPTLVKAMKLLEGETRPDVATLDVSLGGEKVFPVADMLSQRGVPFLFTTGFDQSIIPERFADVPRCEKPVDTGTVCQHLSGLLAVGRGTQ